MEKFKELIILIAEDDDGHAELIIDGLVESGICNQIIRFRNGEEVWHFISGTSDKEVRNKNKRYLLLLDINMPKMNGVEVLVRIKSNKEIKDMPVIMLTSSDSPHEIERCYEIGCNMYITKPIDFGKFAVTLKRLGLFIDIVTI